MLRFIYADELYKYGTLGQEMFRDRAEQFRDRLGWDVHVDADGREMDEYDQLNPLYVIWEMPNGRHGGSMRFLPTTGPCMMHDHFLDLTDGIKVQSPLIWECTRFCLAPDAGPNAAASLMLAGAEIMRGFGIEHFAGVFDARMVRIYRLIGASPEVLGSQGEGRDKISVGLWAFDPANYKRVARAAGTTPEVSQGWFAQSFGKQVNERAQSAA